MLEEFGEYGRVEDENNFRMMQQSGGGCHHGVVCSVLFASVRKSSTGAQLSYFF